jgi:hypothetical protein
MSNGLFIRSYPAVGVQIVPATYHADKFSYILLVLLPVVVIWWAGPANVEKSSSLVWGLAAYVLAAAFATGFLRSLRLEIRTEGISYANLLRETNLLAFSDISTVVVLADPHVRPIKVWRSYWLSNTLVITPKPETGKPTLKIPLYLFPSAAQGQLTHLLRPEEWDVQG